MLNIHELAWDLIDVMIEREYEGSKDALIEEVGDLDEYSFRIVDTIECTPELLEVAGDKEMLYMMISLYL